MKQLHDEEQRNAAAQATNANQGAQSRAKEIQDLAEIIKLKMQDKEAEVQRKLEGMKKPKGPDMTPNPKPLDSKITYEFTTSPAFYESIQKSLLATDDPGKETAKNTADTVDKLEELKQVFTNAPWPKATFG